MRISDWSSDVCSSDLSAQYRFDLPTGDALLLNAAGSYLNSERRLITGQPSTPTAGVIFMPPHLRARGGATWESSNASLSAYVNYIGGVEDQRALPFTHVGSFTSVDLAAHFALSDTTGVRSEEHTSELQSLMRISYDVFCWK